VYAILESEVQLASVVVGLDPEMGVLHTDIPNRPGLALDLIEPLRPSVDRWVLEYLAQHGFDQHAFKEGGDGRVLLDRSIKKELSDTAPLWQRLAIPVAETVAQMFLDVPLAADFAGARRKLQPVKVTRATAPTQPKIETRTCRICGAPTRFRRATCFREHANELRTASLLTANARARMAQLRAEGKDPSTTPEVLAKRSLLSTRNRLAEVAWTDDGGDYSDERWSEIVPGLHLVRVGEIMVACGVSKSYASLVRNGKRKPHPRHWNALITLSAAP
jgi:hypothetical protein